LLLAVVNILLKIKNVVSSEKVAAVGALYNPRRRCGRPCCSLAAAHDKGRRRRGGLDKLNDWEVNLQNARLTCVFARFLPRVLSVSVEAELEGSVAGIGSASGVSGGPGSLMYGALCS
jgi:hypothetical protein